MDGLSDEKRRLEQYLLQTRASNIFPFPKVRKVNPAVKAQINRFQVDAGPIDRIKLVESQILAGKVPVSDALRKAQKKRKKKAKKSKKLRGEVGRNIREQRRFEKGERREKDEDEPRVVGDPDPAAGGLAYDVGVETRRLDLAQAIEDQRRVEAIADRAERRRDRGDDAVFRRLELQARRAGGGAGGGGGGGDRPDPIPEIIRQGDRIRGDYNAFGDEIDRRNRENFAEERAVREAEERARRGRDEEIVARLQAQDENFRAFATAQDARNEELHARFDFHEERSLSQTRPEIADAEERLRGAAQELDRPTDYDDVLIGASTAAELRRSRLRGDRSPPVDRLTLVPASTPTPRSRIQEIQESAPEPEQPRPIAPVSGGGELGLPDITLEADPLEPLPGTTTVRSPSTPAPRSSKARATGGGGGAGETAERLETLLGTRLPVTSPRASIPPVITPAELIEGGSEVRLGPRSGTQPVRLTDTRDFLEESGFARQVADDEPPPGGVADLLEQHEQSIVAAGDQPVVQRPLREAEEEEDVGGEAAFLAPEEEGEIVDRSQAPVEDSKRTFAGSRASLEADGRPGVSGPRGSKRGKGYRVKNNSDRTYNQIEPGDVVNVIGHGEGRQGKGVYVLDTPSAASTRVGLPALSKKVDEGHLLFEKGHRHELGGHFAAEPYGPPPPSAPEPAPEPATPSSPSGETGSPRLDRLVEIAEPISDDED